MKITGVIPARYGSTRFPGKPLANIAGKPMIQHVVEQSRKAKQLHDIIVATDDNRIAKAVKQFGGKVEMTSKNHKNGTERCEEVFQKLSDKADYLLNIQGDEPLISPKLIDTICALIQNKQPEIATAIRPLKNEEEIASPNVVKCVRNLKGQALYFSRSAIPFQRNHKALNKNEPIYYQHIGIYAYNTSILQKLITLPPSLLESIEQLEQLRWLENGFTIDTIVTTEPTFAVDSPEDVEKIETILHEKY